eukprot:924802-Prymnesium_polylepis.1
MVLFLTTTETDHDAVLTARGTHRLYLEESDGAGLLAQAQPDLPMRAAEAPMNLPSLQYGDFAELVLVAASVDGTVTTAVKVATFLASPACLTRLWAEVRKGMSATSWSHCSKGAFKSRLLEAAKAPAVQASRLVIGTLDFYRVPALMNAPAWYLTLSWVEAAADGADIIGEFESYAEARAHTAGVAVDSALSAFVAFSFASAKSAVAAAGGDADHVANMRDSSKAALVLAHWRSAAWPAPLQRWVRNGPDRELDSIARVAYASSGGIGVQAERVVLDRLASVLATPPHLVLAKLTAVKPPPSREQMANALRRGQSIFGVAGADCITLGSLESLAAKIAAKEALVVSPEVSGISTVLDRFEYFVGMANPHPLAGYGGLPPSGAGTSHGAGAPPPPSRRFDAQKVRPPRRFHTAPYAPCARAPRRHARAPWRRVSECVSLPLGRSRAALSGLPPLRRGWTCWRSPTTSRRSAPAYSRSSKGSRSRRS